MISVGFIHIISIIEELWKLELFICKKDIRNFSRLEMEKNKTNTPKYFT